MNSEYRTKLVKNETEILLIGPCSFKKNDHFTQLAKKLKVIAIDGGQNQIDRSNIDLSIGDGDSSNEEMDIKLKIDKDQSDLAAALALLGSEKRKIYAFGFLGARRDHEWINLGELFNFVHKSNSIVELDEHHTFYPRGTHKLNLLGTFSLLSLRENDISISGKCKYILNTPKRFMPLSSHGLSNEGHGQCLITSTEAILISRN